MLGLHLKVMGRPQKINPDNNQLQDHAMNKLLLH